MGKGWIGPSFHILSLHIEERFLKIFLAPHSVEPYITLAAIFEEQGEQEELLKVLLIASSLKRADLDLWVKCAFLAKKMGNVFLTKRCISKGSECLEIMDPPV